MATITPFKIDIPQGKLHRLQKKLQLADFPLEAPNSEPWSQGCPVEDIKTLARWWEHGLDVGPEEGFNWRGAESELNKFPQFTTNIAIQDFGTYDVHFIHQKSEVSTAIPLLFLHGWPGSFIEVTKILPELVKGGEDFPAFHVVAPSLIDFGFSAASNSNDFGFEQHAEAYHKLMLALGYQEYVIEAGDVGYIVARYIAHAYGPRHLKAHHLSNAAPSEPTEESHPDLYAKAQATPLTGSELAGLARTAQFQKEGNGYYKLASTKPLTLNYLLSDSPIALLAYLYEKLHDWSDDYRWSRDEILTWVSLYWFSRAGPGASNSVYWALEHSEPPAFARAAQWSDVPVGISRFPKDLILLPKLWNQSLGPVVYEKEHESGGHFAAWERPDAIVGDLRAMFGKEGGAYGVVGGCDGYRAG